MRRRLPDESPDGVFLRSLTIGAFVFRARVAGAGALLTLVGVVVKFDTSAAQPPNDSPTVIVRELAQVLVAQSLEKLLLARMCNEVLGLARKVLGDRARDRLQALEDLGGHSDPVRSPLIGRLGGGFRPDGKSLGDGGGLGGRLSFAPSDFFAFSDGEGPRTSGFFIGMDRFAHFITVTPCSTVVFRRSCEPVFVMQNRFPSRSQGADVVADGVRYRTWAPGKGNVAVVLYDGAGAVVRTVLLSEEPDGYFSGTDELGRAGDLYKYRFGQSEWPDPASRFNPDGVHGPSQVIDPRAYQWDENNWRCPPLSELILYELHIGTFTPAGTFLSAMEKLDHLADLGVNAIEIMPVADFPGARNWGYDGVSLYAPARVYGLPDDLRALVAAAHERGLAVILDVVYNHLGPDGNYLGAYSREYFNPAHETPWGDAFNFELRAVRDFFLENPGYWRREFHIDGFRLDATHAIIDSSEKHFLAEVAERVHSLGGFVTVEDERNEPQLLRSPQDGGWGLDASWADDFHHVVRVMLTGTREGYYRSYEGTPDELTATLRDGWLLHGEERRRRSAFAPNECGELSPEQFILCITNHDQIGNQAFGERLNQLVAPAAFRAASALLCLAPYTPMIFMGQEWATAAPFQFFTDHEIELGRRVTAGRREEFRGFAAFRDPAVREEIPDPQSEATFLRSKIRWEELNQEAHAGTLRLYRELLRLRRMLPALQDRRRANWQVSEMGNGIVQIVFGKAGSDQCIVLVDLIGGHDAPVLGGDEWQLLLSTNEARFGSEQAAPFVLPEVRVLRRSVRV